MKLTISQIVNAFEPIHKLSGQIPAKISFAIVKNIDLVERELGFFEKARADLFRQYKPTIEGNYARCETEELTQAMANELNDLLCQEVDLPVEVIPLSQVGGMTVDPADMRHLMWMFSEGPDAAPVPGK